MQYTSCYHTDGSGQPLAVPVYHIHHVLVYHAPCKSPQLGHHLNKHSEVLTTIHQARVWIHFIRTTTLTTKVSISFFFKDKKTEVQKPHRPDSNIFARECSLILAQIPMCPFTRLQHDKAHRDSHRNVGVRPPNRPFYEKLSFSLR